MCMWLRPNTRKATSSFRLKALGATDYCTSPQCSRRRNGYLRRPECRYSIQIILVGVDHNLSQSCLPQVYILPGFRPPSDLSGLGPSGTDLVLMLCLLYDDVRAVQLFMIRGFTALPHANFGVVSTREPGPACDHDQR
jgi:hypothetical protein